MELREKRLQYPINITQPKRPDCPGDPQSIRRPRRVNSVHPHARYLSQRFAMPNSSGHGDAHRYRHRGTGPSGMVGTIVTQLTRNLSMEEIKKNGFDKYYVDHTVGIWPQAAGGIPFNACEFQSKGDPITDLFEDMAAEQKARSTYENILRLVKRPGGCRPIRFLRAREIVHFQRFGETLRILQEQLDSKNFYAFNPSFDAPTTCPPCAK